MLSPSSKLEIVEWFGIIVDDTGSEWDPSSGFIVNYWILRSLPFTYSFISFLALSWCHKVLFLPFLLCSLCFWLRNCLCSCLGRTMSRWLMCGLIWPWPLEVQWCTLRGLFIWKWSMMRDFTSQPRSSGLLSACGARVQCSVLSSSCLTWVQVVTSSPLLYTSVGHTSAVHTRGR